MIHSKDNDSLLMYMVGTPSFASCLHSLHLINHDHLHVNSEVVNCIYFCDVIIIEMRQKFDNGEDPLDPEQQNQQGGHGHPFFHGFNPFGSGGGNFKFHFN